MTTPITPPPKLVRQWCHEDGDEPKTSTRWFYSVCAKAAQWGADQELEACVEWLDRNSPVIGGFHLRIDRRPKPPSLKEQALAVLDDCFDRLDSAHENTIRRALEALPE